MEKEKLERISHLSRLSRERNLTDEEIKERMELRGQYIAEIASRCHRRYYGRSLYFWQRQSYFSGSARAGQ